MSDIDLTGKVAVVTGAASGIGAACVERLAGLGAIVVGLDVDDTLGKQVFDKLGGKHRYRHLDVTDQGEWNRAVAEIFEAFGRLDVLLLNAGVMSRPKGAPLLDAPLDWFTRGSYDKVRGVNLDGVVYGLMAVVERGGVPRVIVTASGAAINPLPMDPFYTATKYAVLGLGLALAPSLAQRGTRIDIICPGAIDTPITAPDIKASYKQERVSFVADALIAVLAAPDARNNAWIAYSETEGIKPYAPTGGALDQVESAPV
jgi:NAD(P)-dependent dehydrogenase (short-subunit alcohol dehydrogenase family)